MVTSIIKVMANIVSHLFIKKRYKLIQFVVAFFLFSAISTVQTTWFYRVLNLDVSLRTLLFVALFSFLLTILVFMSISKIWKLLLSVGIFALAIFQLINFVYINLFVGFFSLNSSGDTHIPTMIKTVKEFYMVVPWHIYTVVLCYFLLHTAVIFSFHGKHDSSSVLLSDTSSEQRKIKYAYKTFIFVSQIFLILISLGAGLILQNNYEQHPRDQWWKYNYNLSDKGVYGELFSSLDDFLNPRELIRGEITLAQDTEPDNDNITISTEIIIEKEKTPRMFIKEYLHTLRDEQHGTNNINLPVFDKPMNIVHYQLESMPLWGIVHEPSAAPFLKQLMETYISTDQFFANGCHTIDAEYDVLCSALADAAHPIPDVGSEDDFHCLPQILSENYGYNTAVIHSNTPDFWNREVLDPKWGFKDLLFAPEYFDWFKTDDSLALDQAIDYLKYSSKPAFVEVIGVSSHANHTLEELESIGTRSGGITMNLFEGDLDPDIASRIEITEDATKMYLSFLVNVDKALREFFEDLEKNDLMDNTIVVITNDHRYYNFNGGDERAFDLYNQQPFVLYVPGMETIKLPIVASHMDVAPTLLHLLNNNTDNIPDSFLGTSVFDIDHPNAAVFNCANMINYINHDEIIVGDILAEQYAYLKTNKDSHVVSSYLKQVLQYITDMNSTAIKENTLY